MSGVYPGYKVAGGQLEFWPGSLQVSWGVLGDVVKQTKGKWSVVQLPVVILIPVSSIVNTENTCLISHDTPNEVHWFWLII